MNETFISKNDIFLDYCRYEYTPKNIPEKALKSENILFKSFEIANAEKLSEIVKLLKKEFGINKTVYGIKLKEGKLFWEFYFYTYGGKHKDTTTKKILTIFKKYFGKGIVGNLSSESLMFSIDLSKDTTSINEFHAYFPHKGERSGGPSYLISKKGITLENYYSFFPSEEENEMRKELTNIHHLENTKNLLIKKYLDCYTVCLAKKNKSNCIYYSRVNYDSLIDFLDKFKYPAELINYIKSNQKLFNYLKFDIGYDYTIEDNKIKIDKSGFYGYF